MPAECSLGSPFNTEEVPVKTIQYLRYVDCALRERAQRIVRERRCL